MSSSFLFYAPSWLISSLLCLGIIGLYFVGYKIRQKRIEEKQDTLTDGLGPIEGSLLGLLGLLLAFTFGMASSRHDSRMQIMVDEANNIGTAILRTELYPDSIHKAYIIDFKQYVEARISIYEAKLDEQKKAKSLQLSDSIGTLIWKRTANSAKNGEYLVQTNQMVPAVNTMIDIVTVRNAMNEETVPDSILWLLFILCLVAAFLIGYGTKKKIDWIIISGFAIMTSVTVLLILDLDRPYRGSINMDKSQEKMVALRKMLQ